MMWSRLADKARDWRVFAWLAGAGFWLAWLISLALGGWAHDSAGHRLGADHVQYYVVGQLVNEGSAPSVYDRETMTARQQEIAGPEWKGYLPFRYPPFYALVFAPTSRLTYEASFLAWTAIGMACLLASAWLLVRCPLTPPGPPSPFSALVAPAGAPTSGGGGGEEDSRAGTDSARADAFLPSSPPRGGSTCRSDQRRKRRGGAGGGEGAFLLAALCFYPVFTAVSYGQNSLVSLLLLSACAALWLRDRMLLAGLVAGLLLFKQPMVVGIGLLFLLDIRRSWPALVGMTITALILVGVTWFVWPEMSQAYVASFTQNAGMQEKTRTSLAPLYSSQGFWQLLLGERLDVVSNPLALLTSVAGLIVFVVLWRRWRAHRPVLFGLAVLMTPWLSPYMMSYDWTILLIPAVLLWGQIERDRWTVLAAVLWAASFLAFALVRGQLKLSPIALQLSLPVLIVCVLLLGRPAEAKLESRV